MDSTPTEKAAEMRPNLFHMLGVRDLAIEAQFFDPALLVLLQDVIYT